MEYIRYNAESFSLLANAWSKLDWASLSHLLESRRLINLGAQTCGTSLQCVDVLIQGLRQWHGIARYRWLQWLCRPFPWLLLSRTQVHLTTSTSAAIAASSVRRLTLRWPEGSSDDPRPLGSRLFPKETDPFWLLHKWGDAHQSSTPWGPKRGEPPLERVGSVWRGRATRQIEPKKFDRKSKSNKKKQKTDKKKQPNAFSTLKKSVVSRRNRKKGAGQRAEVMKLQYSYNLSYN